jgi:hypothetical protein
MERQGDEVHIETDEARGGSTPHIVRYVLVISLVLAVLALSLIWITGAVSRDTYPDPVASEAVPVSTTPTGG